VGQAGCPGLICAVGGGPNDRDCARGASGPTTRGERPRLGGQAPSGPTTRGERPRLGGQAASGPTTRAVTSDEDQPCAFGSLAVVVNFSVYVDGVLPEAGVYDDHVSATGSTLLMHGGADTTVLPPESPLV
jgi:hypothetical protein